MAASKVIVAVVGYTGGVGQCLLSAMKKIDLKPFALVRSKTMKVDDEDDISVDFALLSERLIAASKSSGKVPVIADVTASGTLQEEHYKNWLSQGISVVAGASTFA